MLAYKPLAFIAVMQFPARSAKVGEGYNQGTNRPYSGMGLIEPIKLLQHFGNDPFMDLD